jgi:protein-disulfide isomerase
MEPSQQQTSVAIPIAIVAGFGLIALAIFFSGAGQATPSNVTNVDTAINEPAPSNAKIKPVNETDYIRGNPNAPILVVEYSDYDCPFCKNFHETMNQVMNEYGVDGKVAWVYRQFPIAQLHPNAPRISAAALCVGELGGNEAFWNFSDRIFQERDINESTNISRLTEYAESTGVSKADYIACLESERHQETVTASLTDGANAGIQGTPNSFVIVGNQQATIEGAQPYAVVKQIIDNLIGQLEGTTPEEHNPSVN